MRFLILSDIHANLTALEAVLDAAAGRYDSIVCLGDIVGYGPDPSETTAWVQAYAQFTVRGNHDRAAIGDSVVDDFSPAAADAALWTGAQLSADHLRYLADLPPGPLACPGFHICHGSPRDEDEYITGAHAARQNWPWLPGPITFFGHTHLQGGFEYRPSRCWAMPQHATHDLHPDSFYLINPGSVGQPRDGNPHAAYALYDASARALEFCRTPYNIPAVQARLRRTPLHPYLADRLAFGQ